MLHVIEAVRQLRAEAGSARFRQSEVGARLRSRSRHEYARDARAREVRVMSDPSLPLPSPDALTERFWDALSRRRTRGDGMRAGCGHRFLPAAPCCPRCWSDELEPTGVCGRGHVFSFAVYRRTYHPGMPAPTTSSPWSSSRRARDSSRTSSVAVPEEVEIGLPVRVVFEAAGGFVLPRFVPALGAGGES